MNEKVELAVKKVENEIAKAKADYCHRVCVDVWEYRPSSFKDRNEFMNRVLNRVWKMGYHVEWGGGDTLIGVSWY